MSDQTKTNKNTDDPMIIMSRIQDKARQKTLDFEAPEPTQAENATEGEASRKQRLDIHSDILVSLLGNTTNLPSGPSNSTFIPSEMVRSALFNARNRQIKRAFLKDTQLVTIGNHTLKFTGEELRQDDCDIYLKIIELAADQNEKINVDPSTRIPVRFTPHAIARALNKPYTAQFKKRLLESVSRMRAGLLSIESERLYTRTERRSRMITFNLLSELAIEQHPTYAEGNIILCELDIALVVLMQGSHYTRIHWLQRLSLKSNVAKWMIGYFGSHRHPHPIALETVADGCGIQSGRRSTLRQTVRNALKELVRVGFLRDFLIENDIISVERNLETILSSPK